MSPQPQLSPSFPESSKKISEMEVGKKKKEVEELRSFLRQDHAIFGMRQVTFARLFYGVNHIIAVYGLYLLLTGHFASWSLLLFNFLGFNFAGIGVTAGAHRYWTHKSFKANLPLQILLMLMFTMSGQWSIYKWVLDHRIHHKYTDTDKDPHNSTRGFWFSHALWLISPRHPETQKALNSFDLPDLEKDPVVLFNSRYYFHLLFLLSYILPTQCFMYFWGLSLLHAFSLCCLDWVVGTHFASSVNSFAHMFGYRPYNKDISSADNKWVSFVAYGEGWHNYHHTFPWDYKTSEMGWKLNLTTMFIDFFAWIGWAYDLKTVSQEVIQEKMKRSGDGTSHRSKEEYPDEDPNKNQISKLKLDCETTATWGWDDENVSQEFKKMTTILKPSRQE